VNRDEQIGLRLIGKIGALLERQIGVVAAREHYIRAEARLQQLAQALGHVEHEIFFQQSLAANGAQIPAAVTGIEHDAKLCGLRWQSLGRQSPSRQSVGW